MNKLLAFSAIVATATATTTPEPTLSPVTPAPTGSPTTLGYGVGSMVAGPLLGVKAAVYDCRGNATHHQQDGLSAMYNANPQLIGLNIANFMNETATYFEICAATEYAELAASAKCIIADFLQNGLPDFNFPGDDFEPAIPATDSPEFLPWVVRVVDPILSDDAAKVALKQLIDSLKSDLFTATLDSLYCNSLISPTSYAAAYGGYAMGINQGGLLVNSGEVPATRDPPTDCTGMVATPPVNGSLVVTMLDQFKSIDFNKTEEESQAAIFAAIGACAQGFTAPSPAPLTATPIEIFAMKLIALHETDVDNLIAKLINPALKLNQVLANIAFPYDGQLCGLLGQVGQTDFGQCVQTTAPYLGFVSDLVFPGSQFPVTQPNTPCGSFFNKVPPAVVPANILGAINLAFGGALTGAFAATAGLDIAGILDMLISVIPLGAQTCVTPITSAPAPAPTEPPTSSATTAAVSAAAAFAAAAFLL